MKYGYDNITTENKQIKIAGWGFIQGISSDNLKAYVILTRNDTANIFAVEKRIRKDVSKVYADTKMSYDSSGFYTTVSTDEIKPGKYRIGLYLVKDNQVGLVYPDKFVEVTK